MSFNYNISIKNTLQRELKTLLYQSYLQHLKKAVSRKIKSSSTTVQTNFNLQDILLGDGSVNSHINEIIIKLDGNKVITFKVNTNTIKGQL